MRTDARSPPLKPLPLKLPPLSGETPAPWLPPPLKPAVNRGRVWERGLQVAWNGQQGRHSQAAGHEHPGSGIPKEGLVWDGWGQGGAQKSLGNVRLGHGDNRAQVFAYLCHSLGSAIRGSYEVTVQRGPACDTW